MRDQVIAQKEGAVDLMHPTTASNSFLYLRVAWPRGRVGCGNQKHFRKAAGSNRYRMQKAPRPEGGVVAAIPVVLKNDCEWRGPPALAEERIVGRDSISTHEHYCQPVGPMVGTEAWPPLQNLEESVGLGSDEMPVRCWIPRLEMTNPACRGQLMLCNSHPRYRRVAHEAMLWMIQLALNSWAGEPVIDIDEAVCGA